MRILRFPFPLSPLALLPGLLFTPWCLTASADPVGETDAVYGHFSIKRTAAQLLDQSAVENIAELVDADDVITWQVYVPDSYDPDKPAGLLVYISPARFGDMPSGWRLVFSDENLIYISADRSGNRTKTKQRMLYAALAPYVVSEKYEIDSKRVYVSGYSGGGKVASIASVHFANLFSGAIYICGTEFWSGLDRALLPRVKSNRYVFITGGRDFNRLLTGTVYRKYEHAGALNISLMTIPGMGHETPDTERFRSAIHYLDGRE